MDITLEKEIRTSQQKAYKAFSDPAELSKWFTTNAQSDLRIGGRYTNDDKDEGEFLEIIPGQLIRFTWENKGHCPGTEVAVRFAADGENRTKITLIHSNLPDKAGADDMRTGWTWALTSLKSYLETGKSISYGEWEKSMKEKV